ncbi:hypothetical protein GALMADRAFT_141596 [Galerina marginata CBS 339.88]|uniref:Uncharacterized protein n=1 Tax=Galerina marginata (strain CBS 339.88) TaxID=685588 RepID=A0A067T3S9_GALM3|nr:hypothetical protein GALMADRAFT_141596 [Galerina marginata CBS 339.88]
MPYRIQVQRSLVDELAQLEKEVKEQSKKEAQKEQSEAEAPMINPGGFGNLLTNGIVGRAPPMNEMMPSMPGYEFTNNPDPDTTCTAELFETLPDGRFQPLKTFIYPEFEDCGLVIGSRLMSFKANSYARSKYAEAQDNDEEFLKANPGRNYSQASFNHLT